MNNDGRSEWWTLPLELRLKYKVVIQHIVYDILHGDPWRVVDFCYAAEAQSGNKPVHLAAILYAMRYEVEEE